MYDEETRLFDLEWTVDKAGHEIDDGVIRQKSKVVKAYSPFKDTPGVAREFSKIKLDSETKTFDETAALDFANQYGLLGLSGRYGEHEVLSEWYEPIELFWEVFNLLRTDLNDAARLVFNNFGPTPILKMSISSGNRQWLRALEITPTTLYGAMWIMVANEITKGVQLQECVMPGCGKWFTMRTNQQYCSSACKQAAYRERHS